MVRDTIPSVRAEPSTQNPPGPQRRDWLLVAVLVVTALVEGAVRPDIVWRPLAVAVGVAASFTLPWRRTHPLAVLVVTLGSAAVLDVTALLASKEPTGLYTMLYLSCCPSPCSAGPRVATW